MRVPPTSPAHRFPIRVYFEDTDAGGMAYHANYLRWAERARTESLRDMGLPHQLMMERHDAILVVRRVEVEYWRPARLDDALVVETRVIAVKGVTLCWTSGWSSRTGYWQRSGSSWLASTGTRCGRSGYPNPGGPP